MRIENGRLYLIGQVREHADADQIADGLRACGLVVTPPDTHRLKLKGVEFRISATWSPASKSAKKETL